MRGVYNVTLDIYLLPSPDEHYASGSTLGPVTIKEGNAAINISEL